MSDSNNLNKRVQSVKRINGIFGLISFSTILPLNIHTSIEEMAEFTWIWPLIGGFIGILVGTLGFLLVDILHLYSFVAAALVYSFSIWFTGFHHLDGLVDFGDGMMVHGSPEKKIDVMRDKRIGTGGIAYLMMVGLVTFAAIGSAPLSFYILYTPDIRNSSQNGYCYLRNIFRAISRWYWKILHRSNEQESPVNIIYYNICNWILSI